MSIEFKYSKIDKILSDEYNLSSRLSAFAYKNRISTDVIDGLSVYEKKEDADNAYSALGESIKQVSDDVEVLEMSSQNWNESYGRVKELTSDLPKDTIAYKTSLSTSDIGGIEDYVLTSEFREKVKNEFTEFKYVSEQISSGYYGHYIKLTIAGLEKTVDLREIVQSRMIKNVEVYTSGDQKYLKITFILENGELDQVSIKITDMFPVFKEGYGINIDNNLCISIDTSKFGDLSNVNLSELSTEQKLNLKGLSHKDLSDIVGYNICEHTDGKLSAYKCTDLDFKDNFLSSSTQFMKINGISVINTNCDITAISSYSDISVNIDLGSYEKTVNLKDLAYKSLSDISSNFGKAFIKNPGTAISGHLYDLSVVKISIEEYKEKLQNHTISDNTLYIVSSDYIEAYGQQICNLAMGDDFNSASSFTGIAATDVYVQRKIGDLNIHSLASCDLSDIVDENSRITHSNGKLSAYRYTAEDFKGNFLSSSNSYLTSTSTLGDINNNEISDYQKSSELGDLAKMNKSDLGLSNYLSSIEVKGKLALSSIDQLCSEIELSDYSKMDYVDNKLSSIRTDERLSSFFGSKVDEIGMERVVDVLKFILSSFGAV